MPKPCSLPRVDAKRRGALDLAETLRDYGDHLASRGYAERTLVAYSRSVAEFGRWLSFRRQRSTVLDEATVGRFMRRRVPVQRDRGGQLRRLRHEEHAALVHLLQMLRAQGRAPTRRALDEPAIESEITDFKHHLVEARGLSPATRIGRRRDVRAFLRACRARRAHTLSAVRPRAIAEFVASYTAGWRPGSIQAVGNSLRSYLAFKAMHGEPTTALVAAIPRVAHWRFASVPPSLSPQELTRLLGAFDHATATGRRDYAITRCLADLGLRGIEVARLRLDDVDWQAGTLTVRGKGRRVDVLPLPATTGRAIAAYLQHGRPTTPRREVFLRHRPPYDLPTASSLIRNAVRYAARRCGLDQRMSGPHILRHTLATRLVQQGARLKDIADLLRHRSIDTTTIYAKVDLPALSGVALPWPGRRT